MSQPRQFPIMLGLTVADMQKSLSFYRQQLGFQLKECWPSEAEAKWASLVLDGQTIMLGQAMPAAMSEQMHGDNKPAGKFWGRQAALFAEHPHGAGVVCYLTVADVDAYAEQVKGRGLQLELPPTSQFYGLRDFVVTDPDGYVLTFYQPIAMQSCQSCGMPLKDAKCGDMYCHYCVDAEGRLKPYQQVFEGTVTGFFMGMQKMERQAAEQAATAHLANMPAWKHGK